MSEPRFGVRADPPPVEVITELQAEPAVSESHAMAYLGWFLVFIAIAPPVTVILWRIATMPWGAG